MESSRILVTGLPDGAAKTDLTIYFQSSRDSEGGDVRDIQIDGNQAFITFTSAHFFLFFEIKRKTAQQDN